MKKLLAYILIFSAALSAQEDDIKLICTYINETEERFAYQSITSHFDKKPININIFKDKKISRFNGSSWDYFTELKPLEFVITTRVMLVEGRFYVIPNLENYEIIKINRQTGEMMVTNYSKQDFDIEYDIDESYPLAFSMKYECESLKVKF